ncbi:MAG: glycosyltransferase family 2 protein [Pirellula sp.]
MPRLSMIVPFQRDENALESTLLSVLESRTEHDELIIVHSGEYTDPYQLDGDEAVVLESDRDAGMADQLNLAASVACSPVVQVLTPGIQVRDGWADEALDRMEAEHLDYLALAISDAGSGETIYGLDARELPHRRVARRSPQSGGPVLGGSMIRRRTLLQMGGWCESIAAELIDVEWAILSAMLELRGGVHAEAGLVTTQRNIIQPAVSYELGKGCGMLACAYGEIADSGIAIEPLVKRLGNLATGLMNPKLAAERLGWVLGVRDRSMVQRITERVEAARQGIAAMQSIRMPETEVATKRRAA